MADVMPNYKVEIQRIKMQIANQEAAIQKNRLDIMEMADRKQRHINGIEAAERAIGDLKEKMLGLTETHGEVLDSDVADATKSLD